MATSSRIKFVTDSTCDIPQELLEKWGITVVPVFVNIGDKSYADDGVELNREDYYNQLPHLNPLPTTAAPSPGLAKQKLESAFEGADHLVVITLPTKLSATYEALRIGMSDLPADRVTLLDSGSVSLAMGYQVLYGAEAAANGGDLQQVLAAVEYARKRHRLAALINTLEYLRRGGRVNMASAGLGALLQIKPIVTINDGVVETLTRVRTTNRARQELIDMIKRARPFERLTLLHSNNLEGIEWMRAQLRDVLPDDLMIVNVTPTIGTHVGPSCLGFVAVAKSERA